MTCTRCKEPIRTKERGGLWIARCKCGRSTGFLTEMGALLDGKRKRRKSLTTK